MKQIGPHGFGKYNFYLAIKIRGATDKPRRLRAGTFAGIFAGTFAGIFAGIFVGDFCRGFLRGPLSGEAVLVPIIRQFPGSGERVEVVVAGGGVVVVLLDVVGFGLEEFTFGRETEREELYLFAA